MSLREFVETSWMPYLERKGIKPSTRQFYECNLNKHLLPRLGDLPLVEISPMHVEELLRGKKDLSPRTLRNVLAVLQCVLSHAVDNDLIQRSPLRGRYRPVVPRREKPVWTPEQVRTILSAAPQAYRCLFTCAALTGVRMGELLALQWKHVDLEKRQIRIEQSLWHGQLIPPKTAASVRTMPIGEMLRKALADHHRNSCHTSSADFIFCKPDGSPHEPTGLRRDVLYPMLDRSGIQRQARSSGFHAFRHAAASFINAQTGNLKLAQKFGAVARINLGASQAAFPTPRS